MINKILGKIKKATEGFTLVETLVAVLLLASAIAGPLTIASKGLTTATIARDQMVAFYLAQDGVEYVRFIRDSNCLAAGSSGCATGAWLTGLSACTGASGCQIDPLQGAVTACSGTCQVMDKYDDGAGHRYFSYTKGTPTPQQFIRTLTITQPSAAEAVLSVAVSWRTASGVVRSVIVRENLFDWQ